MSLIKLEIFDERRTGMGGVCGGSACFSGQCPDRLFSAVVISERLSSAHVHFAANAVPGDKP